MNGDHSAKMVAGANVGGNNTEKNSPSINIRFFGPIIGIVGKSRDTITIESGAVTVKEIILGLCNRYGERFETIALNKGDLNPGFIVFLNGAHVTNWDRKLSLNDEMELMIASQMKGG